MDLKEQVDQLRQQIESSFDKRLKKLGLTESKGNIRDKDKLPEDRLEERERAKSLIDIFKKEEGSYKQARKKYIEEFAFTFFNRIAALKVMGLKDLIPEPITRRHQHGNRSFAHDIWLENNPEYRSESREGIRDFLRDQFEKQAENIRLFSSDYPYDDLPEKSDLLTIIEEFNEINEERWKSDDIMGWLYEYYNSSRKKELKDSDEDIEWDKVSLSSQIYTPRWVVEFLLNNSLGKLWMEMHPESQLTDNHLIANVPDEATRREKPVKEIKLIDPACGSGNFLLYAYELFKEMYREEGNVPEDDIPKAIIENNLHGVDIDDRSVQIAQLSLYIKVMEDTGEGYTREMNLVSTDFHLPDYKQAQDYFSELELNEDIEAVIRELWGDLEVARKFGSLIRIEEQLDEAREEYIDNGQLDLFREQIDDWENWQGELIQSLHKAVSSYATSDGFQTNFLKSQSDRGLKFLEIILSEYDVASANPPYVDSSDYGKIYKDFMDSNFKNGSNYAGNSYAAFFKRLNEMISESGKLAFICTLSSMYIPKYKDLRDLILNNFQINQFVEFGLGGSFEDYIRVRPVFMTLDSDFRNAHNASFFSLDQYSSTKLQNRKRDFLIDALKAEITEETDKHLYNINQEKFKKINGWPFIYWISDDFRKKFSGQSLGDVLDIKQGMATSNNLRFLRFWWEVSQSDISENYAIDEKKWVPYSKGGPWKKWYGNLWLCVNWRDNGKALRDFDRSVLRNKEYYLKEGITYSYSGTKGVTFRHLPPNHIFDVGGSCVFLERDFDNIFYTLALLNSKLSSYIADCLNPTVNTQVGDLKRVPFVEPNEKVEKLVTKLSKSNVKSKKELTTYDPVERIFKSSPLEFGEKGLSLKESFDHFFTYENKLIAEILINEALVNEIIFDVYELTAEDRQSVIKQQGEPAGQYPISESSKAAFLAKSDTQKKVVEYVKQIPTLDQGNQNLKKKKKNLLNKYKTISKDGEAVRRLSGEFEVNPLTVAEWIEDSRVLPEKKVEDHAQKYILVLVREVLKQDQDGIVPIAEFSGESMLKDRIEELLINKKGFTQRNINELEEFLGQDLESYLQNHFFENESNLLNKFMYQPKTPFIWHLNSGEHGGFEVATIIYKWNRDRLISIKNKYLEKRRQAVKRQLNDLGEDESPEAQKKRETYRAQLEEIDEFEDKVIDLLESGYDPVLDDGVGYNIAPLQKRDMLKYDPLTSSQMDKFLNADWGSRAEGDEDA